MAHNKKIKSLTSFVGTHTRGLLRIIAHMPAPLIYKLYAFEEFMLSIAEQNKEVYVKSYCQNWLRLLSLQKFSEAQKLLDCPNSYGETWTEAKLKFAVQEYYDDTSPVTFHNEDLSRCFPEYLETGSGNLIFGFYLPSNSEITDLTVEFEFIPQGNGFYAATINDVHVL